MRYVYADEAGTADQDPVRVVVGVVVRPDEHWASAHDALYELIDTRVPNHLREDQFVCHAMDIWNKKELREGWSVGDRFQFLQDLMSLPRRLGLPILLGTTRNQGWSPDPSWSATETEHAMAFSICISQADRYLRRFGDPQELVTVVAEDTEIRGRRKILRGAVDALRGEAFVYPEMRPTYREGLLGFSIQDPVTAVTRLVDTIHFAAKGDAPILQLADACAFGLKRYLAGNPQGNEFGLAVLGQPLHLPDWAGPASGAYFPQVPMGFGSSFASPSSAS